jgi:hypothetical protein
VLQVVKATLNIAFDEPFGSCPRLLDFAQSGVATPVRTKAVGTSPELRLIVCFKNHTHHFLDQLVAPVRNREWALRAVSFWNVGAAARFPAV